jgi:hypothetical protein
VTGVVRAPSMDVIAGPTSFPLEAPRAGEFRERDNNSNSNTNTSTNTNTAAVTKTTTTTPGVPPRCEDVVGHRYSTTAPPGGVLGNVLSFEPNTPGTVSSLVVRAVSTSTLLSGDHIQLDFGTSVGLRTNGQVAVLVHSPAGVTATGHVVFAGVTSTSTRIISSFIVDVESPFAIAGGSTIEFEITGLINPPSVRSASIAVLSAYDSSSPTGSSSLQKQTRVSCPAFVPGGISKVAHAAFFQGSTPSVEDRLWLSFGTTGEIVVNGHIRVSFRGARFARPASRTSSVHVWSSSTGVVVRSGDGVWTGEDQFDVQLLEAVPPHQSLQVVIGNLTSPSWVTAGGVQAVAVATTDEMNALVDDTSAASLFYIEEVVAGAIEQCVFSSQFHAQAGMVAGMLGDATLRFRVQGSILPSGRIVVLLDDEEWWSYGDEAAAAFACRMEVNGESTADCSGEWWAAAAGVRDPGGGGGGAGGGGIMLTIRPHVSVTIPAHGAVVVTIPNVRTPPSTRPASDAYIWSMNAAGPSSSSSFSGLFSGVEEEEGMVDGISRCSVPDISRGLLQLGSASGDGRVIVVEQIKLLDFTGLCVCEA